MGTIQFVHILCGAESLVRHDAELREAVCLQRSDESFERDFVGDVAGEYGIICGNVAPRTYEDCEVDLFETLLVPVVSGPDLGYPLDIR